MFDIHTCYLSILTSQLFLYHQISTNQTDQKHLNKHQCDKNDLKWQKSSWTNIYLMSTLSLVHVPSSNMEEDKFMTNTEASHQGAIQMLLFPVGAVWLTQSHLHLAPDAVNGGVTQVDSPSALTLRMTTQRTTQHTTCFLSAASCRSSWSLPLQLLGLWSRFWTSAPDIQPTHVSTTSRQVLVIHISWALLG